MPEQSAITAEQCDRKHAGIRRVALALICVAITVSIASFVGFSKHNAQSTEVITAIKTKVEAQAGINAEIKEALKALRESSKNLETNVGILLERTKKD